MPPRLILASTSEIRNSLLRRAGLTFIALKPQVDEDQWKAKGSGSAAETMALDLAKAKASSIAQTNALVLGADQTLSLDGELFSKPQSTDEARRQLQRFRGRTHHLHSALAIALNGSIIWTHVSEARLAMRPLSDVFIDDYLAQEGEDCLHSVGCYKLEDRGIQLFDRIDGDYFTILGLPLLPLLHFLRQQGIIAT